MASHKMYFNASLCSALLHCCCAIFVVIIAVERAHCNSIFKSISIKTRIFCYYCCCCRFSFTFSIFDFNVKFLVENLKFPQKYSSYVETKYLNIRKKNVQSNCPCECGKSVMKDATPPLKRSTGLYTLSYNMHVDKYS